MMMMRFAPVLCALISVGFTANAQQSTEIDYLLPVKITPYLSGNFGELRPNHFHSGIDFKTQGIVGHDILAIEDGRVARIAISPRGYGKALYIEHPNGHTSVYAHLLNFSAEIDKYVKEYQYGHETFALDIYPEGNILPVKKGQVIAKSGNTGSSGGPHLHFEIRDTKSEVTLDPLIYYKKQIKDNVAPKFTSINIYPFEGVVNGNTDKVTSAVSVNDKGVNFIKTPITAWGKIGLGVKAYDFMTSTSNKYGVKDVKLYLDDKLITHIVTDTISFELTRYINSYLDYADYVSKRSYVMRMYRQPGNKLNIYKTLANDGIIDINEEKPYKFRFVLTDDFNNKRTLNFTINGKSQDIPDKTQMGNDLFRYDLNNYFEDDRFSIYMPKGTLYEDLDFSCSAVPSSYYSDIHSVSNRTVPIHRPSHIEIPLKNDTLADKSKYYLANIYRENKSFIASEYDDGMMYAQIRTLGDYVVMADNTAPTITAIGKVNWSNKKRVSFKILDKESGIKSYKGTIDDKFALFEYDAKTNTLFYDFDTTRLVRNKQHKVVITVIDNCGNTRVLDSSFFL